MVIKMMFNIFKILILLSLFGCDNCLVAPKDSNKDGKKQNNEDTNNILKKSTEEMETIDNKCAAITQEDLCNADEDCAWILACMSKDIQDEFFKNETIKKFMQEAKEKSEKDWNNKKNVLIKKYPDDPFVEFNLVDDHDEIGPFIKQIKNLYAKASLFISLQDNKEKISKIPKSLSIRKDLNPEIFALTQEIEKILNPAITTSSDKDKTKKSDKTKENIVLNQNDLDSLFSDKLSSNMKKGDLKNLSQDDKTKLFKQARELIKAPDMGYLIENIANIKESDTTKTLLNNLLEYNNNFKNLTNNDIGFILLQINTNISNKKYDYVKDILSALFENPNFNHQDDYLKDIYRYILNHKENDLVKHKELINFMLEKQQPGLCLKNNNGHTEILRLILESEILKDDFSKLKAYIKKTNDIADKKEYNAITNFISSHNEYKHLLE